MRRYEQVEHSKYLIYPYRNGVALTEAELERQFPQTYRYLAGYREILSGRTSISASGLRWYELVRRRDTEWLRKPKLLIRDLAPETAFAVDPQGGIFIVGGTAVVPETEELLQPLVAYLNSRAINSLMRRITPQFRGGFQKFEPQHLQQIPVLRRIIEDQSLSDELARLAAAATESARALGEREEASDEIDKVVAAAMSAAGIDVSI